MFTLKRISGNQQRTILIALFGLVSLGAAAQLTGKEKTTSTAGSSALERMYLTSTDSITPPTTTQPYTPSTDTDNTGKWIGAFNFLEFGFLSLPESYDFGYTMAWSIGAHYWFNKNAYAGGKIGYKMANSWDREDRYRIDVTGHFIHIPLEIGYTIYNKSQKFGIIPYTGFDLDLGVGGKSVQAYYPDYDEKKSKLKIGGDVGIGLRLGLKIMIHHFPIYATYTLPLNKKHKNFFGEDGHFQIGLGF